jgi:hypothetical protein
VLHQPFEQSRVELLFDTVVQRSSAVPVLEVDFRALSARNLTASNRHQHQHARNGIILATMSICALAPISDPDS